ncbi:MAG: carboxypeptidase-like regulatory domain-containing protein, partial [Acidimicrobiia bacterium]
MTRHHIVPMPQLGRTAILVAGAVQLALLAACGAQPVAKPTAGAADVRAPVAAPSEAAQASAVPGVSGSTTMAPESTSVTTTPSPRSGTIRGHVTDEDGAAIRDASVYITTGTALVPQMAVFTDVAGAFVWRVPAGTFTVEVSRD